MNKIIRENYPASKLPEDLRAPFPPGAVVNVTVEAATATSQKSFNAIRLQVEEAQRAGQWPSITVEEAASRVRTLRDEWDR